MNLLDKLVKVVISVSGAVEDTESFDNMLIVGPAPAKYPASAPSKVGVYFSALEVANAGFATTDPVYVAASVAFTNGATKIYIAVQQDAEEIETTLNRALETSGWYGFAICGADAEDNEKAAEWAQTNQKLYGFTVNGTTNPVGTTNLYAFGFASKNMETYPNNAYTHIALMATAMNYVAGSETWAYKSLKGIEPENFTSTEIATIEGAGLNYFVNCAGKNITLNGKTVGGEWIDIIRFRDWLKNDMQKRIYNALSANAKVSYTNAGITLIENQMLASLKQGQAQGGIPETEYDEDGNEILGFTTSVPKSSSSSDADRDKRTLKNCKFTARLAGAIHLAEISGNLAE